MGLPRLVEYSSESDEADLGEAWAARAQWTVLGLFGSERDVVRG